MKKELYTELKARIESQLGNAIQTIDLWNNQILSEEVEGAFRFPAVFFEFSPIEYRSEGAGIQKLDFELILHVCFNQTRFDVTLLDIVQDIVVALHGYSGDFYSHIGRVREEQDIDHANVVVWNVVFSCTATDDTTANQNKLSLLESAPSLEITKDLDIDDDVIRTGDGQD